MVSLDKDNLDVTITEHISWAGTVKEIFNEEAENIAEEIEDSSPITAEFLSEDDKFDIMVKVSDEIEYQEGEDESPDYISAVHEAVREWIESKIGTEVAL